MHFLSEEEHSSILALMWYLGWPVVLLALALIALALWRNSVRFGPLVAVPEQARRSLAEQIRGTGLFVIRFGGGRGESEPVTEPIAAGDTSVRVVATVPLTAGMSRLDELVASLAQTRLWLTDAYYAGMTSYVQSLTAAAKDGVDVRLLVPNGTDIPLLRPLSRAGYRPLLESGVRIFEWNGTMVHAKTAVADGRWARVGSSNLNVASWFGNCELDLVVEDEGFSREMEQMYLQDLTNATEIILDSNKRVRAPGEPPHSSPVMTSGGGSAGRAAAGALRIGSAVGAAFANRRPFEPVEARLLAVTGSLLIGFMILLVYVPALLIYPGIVVLAWMGLALLYRAFKLYKG